MDNAPRTVNTTSLSTDKKSNSNDFSIDHTTQEMLNNIPHEILLNNWSELKPSIKILRDYHESFIEESWAARVL